MKNAFSDKLSLSFDVGHSSIGWAVLTTPDNAAPDILGSGVVLFEKDSALANQRRLHRSQRRHVRATRMRVARMERVLIHLGVFTAADLKASHKAAGGHSAPWLLAARVLASRGERKLNWFELWHVLRWYAHNRGYESIAAESTNEEDTKKVLNAKAAMDSLRSGTMAETICAWLGLDPLAEKLASMENYKAKDAAFERVVVKSEVRQILQAHIGALPKLDETLISALLDDASVLPCPEVRLPQRYQGGLLFGRLAIRYHNRIIGLCPVSGEKIPVKDCPEFYRFRWAMLLANIMVMPTGAKELRPLTVEERRTLTSDVEALGYFTPAKFRSRVREVTNSCRDNLDQMFMDATAAENLILDPAKRLVFSNTWLSSVWPCLPDKVKLHALNHWRRGRPQSIDMLRENAADFGADLSAFDRAIEPLTRVSSGRGKNKQEPPSREVILSTLFSANKMGGRAPYSRKILIQAYDEVMSGGHPRVAGGCLFETPDERLTKDKRTLDQQTNNHLVRHRLQILGRLLNQLIADPSYGNKQPERIERLVIEVNRDMRTMAGMTAQDMAKEMNERLRSHSSVSKRLLKDLPEGTKINASLIRKARIADDLEWTCPYTGVEFEPIDLVTKRVDLDHIIPRSQRQSDSLDSLVVTFSEINKWKGARTAWQFVKDEQTKPVSAKENLSIMSLKRYEEFVSKLDKKGHPDDQKRKKRRIEKLLLESYEEKSGDFTPGHLTQTSQLTRLGQKVLLEPFVSLEQRPAFVALPGQVTGEMRKGWDLLGCLATANPDVLEAAEVANGGGRTKTKTEIRNVTHLHHALDACVLGLAAHYFPNNQSGMWNLLAQRRHTPEQRKLLSSLGLFDYDQEGRFRLRDLPEEIKKKIRERLAEKRVIQHVPSDMSGMRLEENTRGVVKRENGRVFLRQRKPNADGRVVINETSEVEAKVIGLPEANGKGGKLAAIKGVRVIVDNYGVAILDDEKLPVEERFVIIPHAQVWAQLQKLKERNGGRLPNLWRNGQILELKKGKRVGCWRICSIKNNASGMALDLAPVDAVKPNWINVLLKSLLRDGAAVKRRRLTGEVVA